jgi:hypothetical protein
VLLCPTSQDEEHNDDSQKMVWMTIPWAAMLPPQRYRKSFQALGFAPASPVAVWEKRKWTSEKRSWTRSDRVERQAPELEGTTCLVNNACCL